MSRTAEREKAGRDLARETHAGMTIYTMAELHDFASTHGERWPDATEEQNAFCYGVLDELDIIARTETD